jgi:hypothetical protein
MYTPAHSIRECSTVIVERLTFQAKYGAGDELVALLTEFDRKMAAQMGASATRIYTDATGTMFTVQHESDYADLQAYAASQSQEADMYASADFRDFFARMVPLVEKGERQLFNMTTMS